MPKKSSSKSKKSFNFINISKHDPDLRKKEPPLVDIEVSNPITYLKSWWKRVMSGEGIDFRFRIKPLTAIAMTIIIATFGFGLGRFSLSSKKPFIKYVPVPTNTFPTPMPTINPRRQTAFRGQLRYSGNSQSYFLLTDSAEAITLDTSKMGEINHLIDKQVFVAGEFNPQNRILKVIEVIED